MRRATVEWLADYTVGLMVVVAHLVMVAFHERRTRARSGG